MAKISTLFDYFNGTTLDTGKWIISTPPFPDPNSTITVSGGNLTITQATQAITLISSSSYDWQNSSFVMGAVTGPFSLNVSSSELINSGTTISVTSNFGDTTHASIAYNPSTMKFFRYTGTSSSVSYHYSADNITWTLIATASVTPPANYPVSLGVGISNSTFTTEAINPVPPIAEIVSPANATVLSTTTPTLTFKATDQQGDTVTYQVQITTDVDFVTLHEDKLSSTRTGFSGASDPYTSGTNVTYTVQSPLTEGAITYYWRVRSKDPTGSNVWSSWTPTQTVITATLPPVVTSGTSSAVTANTATVTGEVTYDGGATITERGIVYGTSANPTTADGKKIVAGSTGFFTTGLTDLASNTDYNWRAYATNSLTTSYGSNNTFTTSTAPAIINTIYSITDVSASIDVDVIPGGDANISEKGVVYSTLPTPTTADNKVIAGTGSSDFIAQITGLTETTTYYVRAYTINSQGVSYSIETSFETAQPLSVPTITSGIIENVTSTTFELNNSEVVLDGTQTVTERGVVFSRINDSPSIEDEKVIAGTAGLGVYSVVATGLTPESEYFARAYAINSEGVGYGVVRTFSTPALFIPDQGDGYWTWVPNGSTVTVGRTQATPEYSSANLFLSNLGLEDGETYTLYYSSSESDHGQTSVVLQWYDNLIKMQEVITPGEPYTFTYDTSRLSWVIRLFVTGEDPEPENINATFNDMYIAKEAEFSNFVAFERRGLTEIKLINNWLLDKRREDAVKDIFDSIHGIGWRQFKANTTGVGWLEVGDLFTVQEKTGTKEVIVWDTSLTVDGGIREILSAESPEETETDYSKAGQVAKTLRRTQISVDHNQQLIESIAGDVYDEGGVIYTKFSQIEQDIEGVRTTVESSGGVNLVRNSVMYSYSDAGVPALWDVTGTGTLTIQASPESLSSGGISGNVFSLNDKSVSQSVTVRKDVNYILQADKMYYSFSARVKKNIVGVASITLTNRNESHTIDLPDQTEFYWEVVSVEGLLPLDDYYTITFTSDADANLQVTDVMLSPGENIRQWTQSNGEAMNTNVAITDDGMTIRSNVFRNDYTKIDALGFEVHKHEAGGERVFGFNGDETNVRKLKADYQISLAPIRMIPINYGSYKGMVFTRTEED